MRLLLAALCGPLLAACGAEFDMPGSSAPERPDTCNPATPDVDTATTDPGTITVTPYFWSMQATVIMAAGVVDTDNSRVGVHTWSEQAEVLCAYDVPLMSSADAMLVDPDISPVAWWDWILDAAASEQTECPDWPAMTFEVGFGPVDPRFGPSLDARSWSDADLYGAYYRQSAMSELYSIGVGGTSEQLGGMAATVAEGPLPDGVYELHTLILLDL